MNSFRDRLKTQTLPEHRRLEAALRMTDPDFSEADYRRILARWTEFFLAFETLLSAGPTILDSLKAFASDRRKTPWLEADTKALGLRIVPGNVEQARRFLEPRLLQAASAWGLLYVTEGSTLGAQFLSKHFGKKFSVNDASGLRFYTGYGILTPGRWKEFVSRIETLEFSETDQEIGVRAARELFAFLADFLLLPKGAE